MIDQKISIHFFSLNKRYSIYRFTWVLIRSYATEGDIMSAIFDNDKFILKSQQDLKNLIQRVLNQRDGIIDDTPKILSVREKDREIN